MAYHYLMSNDDKKFQGAGGTPGGTGSYFLGLLMMILGFYWLLKSITVTNGFSLGVGLYRPDLMGFGFPLTGGMILIPMLFGVGFIFYNAKSVLGWILSVGSLACLLFGVITSLHFVMRPMSLFDLLVTLVLCIGGVGLFLRSLKDAGK